MTKYL